MSRSTPRTINELGFFVQADDTVGCTGGRDNLLRFGLALTLKTVLQSVEHASQYRLVRTDRTYFVGLVNIKYKDIYVTKHELDVLEGLHQFLNFASSVLNLALSLLPYIMNLVLRIHWRLGLGPHFRSLCPSAPQI